MFPLLPVLIFNFIKLSKEEYPEPQVISCSVCDKESIKNCKLKSPTGQEFVVGKSLNVDNGRIKCLCNEVRNLGDPTVPDMLILD